VAVFHASLGEHSVSPQGVLSEPSLRRQRVSATTR